jgi:hypothetical protein
VGAAAEGAALHDEVEGAGWASPVAWVADAEGM